MSKKDEIADFKKCQWQTKTSPCFCRLTVQYGNWRENLTQAATTSDITDPPKRICLHFDRWALEWFVFRKKSQQFSDFPEIPWKRTTEYDLNHNLSTRKSRKASLRCTKTRKHRNTGTPRNTGTVEKTRNTKFDGVVLFSHYRPCRKKVKRKTERKNEEIKNKERKKEVNKEISR